MVKKTPSSSQPVTAPLATIDGSLLANTTNTNYLAFISRGDAALGLIGKQSDFSLDGSEEEPEDPANPDDPNNQDDSTESEVANKAPLLSDIKVLSNEIIFDKTNNPTVKVVFRITNSSGVSLKGVGVRVQKQ
jgi:hypothetical protein